MEPARASHSRHAVRFPLPGPVTAGRSVAQEKPRAGVPLITALESAPPLRNQRLQAGGRIAGKADIDVS